MDEIFLLFIKKLYIHIFLMFFYGLKNLNSNKFFMDTYNQINQEP